MSSRTTLLRPVLAVLLIAVLISSASAKTNSMSIAQPGALDVLPLDKAPSLTVPQPMQTEVSGKYPCVDMGFHPLNIDTARQSLIWHAFPQPPQVEIFEKAPSIDIDMHPMDTAMKAPSTAVKQPLQMEILERPPLIDMGIFPADGTRKSPSVAVKQPLQTEVLEKRPSEAVRQPQQADPTRKNPSIAVAQPMQTDPLDKAPSTAVKQPLQVEVLERQPLIDMGIFPADGTRKNPSVAVKQPLQTEVLEKTPSLEVAQPMQIECAGPTLHLELKHAANVEIVVYSVTGRVVKTMMNEAVPAGLHELTWDGRDNNGARAASGVYFARVMADGQTGKGKLVLVR